MKSKIVYFVGLLLSLSANAEVGTLNVGFGYGNVFSNPKELNTNISLSNQAYGISAPNIEDAAKISLYGDYQLNEDWALGLSYARMSPWTSASAVVGGSSVSGKLETSTSLLGLRAKYTMIRNGNFSMFLIPTLGLGFYGTEYNASLGGTKSSVSASKTGITGGLSVSGKVSLNKTIGIALDLGYQIASSGTLTVDSQSGTSLTPGEDYVTFGSPMKLDFGGVYIAGGIEFSFDTVGDNSSAK